MHRGYVPRRGDLVWLQMNPQAGREQAGKRPALVLSPEAYNRKTGLFVACPVTGREKGYPFEVRLPDGCEITGVVLSDQIKSLDWRARKARLACRVPPNVMEETLAKTLALLT